MSVFQRVEPDDPNRCQATHARFQCPFRAVGSRIRNPKNPDELIWEGPKYCPRHSGTQQTTESKTATTRIYLSALWKDKIGQQADHPKYKSLREEMGILRMTLDRKLDSCTDNTELLMYAGAITEMVREIGSLAKTAHAIEKDMGHLLDKPQAEAWIQELLGIISMYITDPATLQILAEDMILSLERRTSNAP